MFFFVTRMLNGFECLTADQLVKQNVKEWNQVVRMKFDLNFIKYNYSVKEEYWNSVLNETENILVKSLARRKKKCNRRTYVLSGLRLKQNMTDEQYLEDFEKRKELNKNTSSFNLMCWFELATMAGNSFASFLIVVIAVFNLELPLLHVPWLLLTAIEITGNICVALAFSVVPGYCLLTSAVCVIRALWLGTIWSKTIRKET